MEATFSEPMKLSDGKTIQPTGKKVKIPMAMPDEKKAVLPLPPQSLLVT